MQNHNNFQPRSPGGTQHMERSKAVAPAVVYGRFSPRPNAEECDSVEKQLQRCRAYCTSHDYEIVGEFKDEDLSGGRADNRPGLQEAIDRACRQRAVLVV